MNVEEPTRAPVAAIRRDSQILTLAGTAIVLLCGSVALAASHRVPLETAANVATVSAVAVWILLMRVAPRGAWSSSAVFFAIFSVFHFGMTACVGFGLRLPIAFKAAAGQWLHAQETVSAVLVSALGGIAFALGVQIALLRRGAHGDRTGRAGVLGRRISNVGMLIIVGAIAAWLSVVVSRGGWRLAVGSYQAFLRATEGSALPDVYLAINIGAALLGAGAKTPSRRLGMWVFAVWSAFAFPLGLRGEVLFPVATIAVLRARARRMPAFGWIIVGAAVVLSAVSVVRQVRDVGLVGRVQDVEINPVEGLAELGSSLRPVTEVMRWIGSGDALLLGASYWAPVDRALAHLLPGWERPPIEREKRISNIVTVARVGPIGFSPIAEGYRNGGVLGALLAMLLLGWCVGRIDAAGSGPASCAMQGVILVPLLNHIRNDFAPVPAQIAIGVFLVLALRIRILSRADEIDALPVHSRAGGR